MLGDGAGEVWLHPDRAVDRDSCPHRRAAGARGLGRAGLPDGRQRPARGRPGRVRRPTAGDAAHQGVYRAERRGGRAVPRQHTSRFDQLALRPPGRPGLADPGTEQLPDRSRTMAPRQRGDGHLVPYLGRRGGGFTLAELLIALVLLGTIAAVTYRIMTTGQRGYHAHTQRVDLQQSLRAAAAALPAELRVLNARDGDILGMGSDSITIRAMRLFAVACDTPTLDGGATTGKTVVIRNSLTFGSRMLTAGDSVLIYYEGRPGDRSDDGW